MPNKPSFVFVILLVCLIIIVSVLLLQKPKECPSCPECICPDCVMDCSLCPEKIKTETKTVETIKYVCPDGRDVDRKQDCLNQDDIDFEPVMTNQEGTSINEVNVKPACIRGNNGGFVYFNTSILPKEIIFQVKESIDEEYREIHRMNGVFYKYTYFEICETCLSNADFSIEKDKVYLFRIMFNMTVLNKVYYSNEHILDTRENSDYIKKKC